MIITDSYQPDYTDCPEPIEEILKAGNFVAVTDYTVNDGDVATTPTGDAWLVAYHNDGIEPTQFYLVYDFDLTEVVFCHDVTPSTSTVLAEGDKMLYWLPTWKYAALGEYQGSDSNGMKVLTVANTLVRIDSTTGYRYWPLTGNEALISAAIVTWTAEQQVGLEPA